MLLIGVCAAGVEQLGTAEELTKVQEAAARVSDEVATQTYRAWIVAMNGQRKALKWSKADIVSNANLYAREVLGRVNVPTLPRKNQPPGHSGAANAWCPLCCALCTRT